MPRRPCPAYCRRKNTTKREYTISITRDVSNARLAALLARAEATYPDRGAVLTAWRKELDQTGEPPAADVPLWWYHKVDSVRIPYAITGDAVNYYRDLVIKARKNGSMLSVQLRYHASVEHHAVWKSEGRVFRNVDVVSLELWYEQICGNVCALDLEKSRQVVFDEQGRTVGVFGDGKTAYGVA